MSPPGGFQPRPESGYTGTSSPVLSGPALYGPEELMFIRMWCLVPWSSSRVRSPCVITSVIVPSPVPVRS